MPVGDSITKGSGSYPNFNGYRKPLYLKLINEGYDVDFVGTQTDGDFADPNHEGHGSWTDFDIAWGQVGYPIDGIYAWLEQNPADIILLHIGTNNIDTSSDDVEDILDEIDRYESDYGTEVTIFVARIIKRFGFEETIRIFNDNVQAMIQDRISNPNNPAYPDNIIPPNDVDMENTLIYPDDYSDYTHPNNTGYAKMANVWYNALTGKRTLTCSSTEGGTITQPGEGVFDYNDGTIVNISAVANFNLNYSFVKWTGTAVDADKVADVNSSNTIVTIDSDYTVIANFVQNGNKLEEINQRLEFKTNGDVNDFTAFYTANGWYFDLSENFAIQIDFHYNDTSVAEGWIGISVGDDANYISISAGSDSNESYFYYEAVVDGNIVLEKESRTFNDGTFYISYDAASKNFYVSHIGFGSQNAHIWQAPDPLQGQWLLPVDVFIGGGSDGATLGPGEAYLDNFIVMIATLIDWPPITDLNSDGFIDWEDLRILSENWLDSGTGDIYKDENDIINLLDFTELAEAW